MERELVDGVLELDASRRTGSCSLCEKMGMTTPTVWVIVVLQRMFCVMRLV